MERETMVKEAVKRLHMVDYYELSIDEFEKYGYVMINEPPFGAHFYAHDDERLKAEIDRLEKNGDAVVYAVVRAFTDLGEMDSLLFVSKYREEWKMDRENLKEGIAFTYTINWDMPDCSEYGSIGFRQTIAGGLQRIW